MNGFRFKYYTKWHLNMHRFWTVKYKFSKSENEKNRKSFCIFMRLCADIFRPLNRVRAISFNRRVEREREIEASLFAHSIQRWLFIWSSEVRFTGSKWKSFVIYNEKHLIVPFDTVWICRFENYLVFLCFRSKWNCQQDRCQLSTYFLWCRAL